MNLKVGKMGVTHFACLSSCFFDVSEPVGRFFDRVENGAVEGVQHAKTFAQLFIDLIFQKVYYLIDAIDFIICAVKPVFRSGSGI